MGLLAVVYEDWYLVDDFTALGALNEAAVPAIADGPMTRSRAWRAWEWPASTPSTRAPHSLSDAARAGWFGKTAGVSYDEFFDRLGERRSLWQRQMVLGPTPEFCSVDDDDLPAGAVVVSRIRKVGASAA